jgi:hypothetical protein
MWLERWLIGVIYNINGGGLCMPEGRMSSHPRREEGTRKHE